MKKLKNTVSVIAITASMIVFASQSGQAFTTKDTYHEFNIKSQSLIGAINDFSRQTDIQILYSHDLIKTLKTNGLVGRYNSEEGLFRLFKNMGLSLKQTASNTYAVVDMANKDAPPLQKISLSVSAEEAAYYEENLAAYDEDENIDDVEDNVMEAIIVTGTRSKNRSVYQSLAPIDVIAGSAISNTTTDELVDSLAQLIPSFNVKRLAMADGTIFVRPATLRNLSPDQTLVMVNGKRRHRSALLAGRTGAQAPDMAVIPSYGISRVEVLRDGAAAQYGSDAIAGVVNVILDTEPGFSVYGQYGQYYQGDGEQFRVGGKAGFELGDDGYIVVTAEYNSTGRTVRSRQRPDAAAFQLANPNIDVRNPAQQWGQPERKSVRIMVNSKVAVDENMNFYAFGTFAGGKGSSDFNWRNPDTSSAFKLSPNVFPNFDLRTIFPGGFTPQFGQDDRDYSAVVGLEGYITPDFTYDASIGYGKNQIVYFMSDTFNPSLGPDSPTTFKPGTLEQEEVNFNLDFVYTLATDAFADDISIAFGAERRNETYSVILGDLASRQIGPGAADGLPATSNGFSGFNDSQVGDFSQNNIGLYLDVEVPVTDQWTVGGAIRFEDYSIFGNTLDVKFSTRYEINDNFAVRATASTGFRAPTPAQLFSERIDQTFDPFNPAQLDTNGRFSSEGEIAELISQRDGVTISPLDAEESNNYTLGFVYNADNGFSATIDLYQIDIDKRLGTTTNFALTDAERNQLVALNVPNASGLTSVRFFQNDFDTRTRGIDVILAYSMDAGEGRLNTSVAYNFNDTNVTGGNLLGNEVARRTLEESVPRNNAVLSLNYIIDALDITARARYYGSWTDRAGAGQNNSIFQEFGAEVFVDLNVSYQVTENVRFRIGAENIFNGFPDEATFQRERGLIYSRNAPYNVDGGKYFVRVDIDF